MEQGIRNTPLNFDVISTQPLERYKRSSSEHSPKEIAKLHKTIKEKLSSLQNQQASTFEFTPPRYDDEFFQGLSKLDEAPT